MIRFPQLAHSFVGGPSIAVLFVEMVIELFNKPFPSATKQKYSITLRSNHSKKIQVVHSLSRTRVHNLLQKFANIDEIFNKNAFPKVNIDLSMPSDKLDQPIDFQHSLPARNST